MFPKRFRFQTLTEGDEQTTSSLYDYFHVTCGERAIELEEAIVLFFRVSSGG
jgi:hypothetical protein